MWKSFCDTLIKDSKSWRVGKYVDDTGRLFSQDFGRSSYTDKIFSRFFMSVLVANQKCDWCQFHWLRGYLDVAMAVIYY